MLLTVALALGKPLPPNAPEARLSGALAEAWRAPDPVAFAARQPRFASGAQVVVETDDEVDAASLSAMGAVVEVAVDGLVQLRLPVDQLAALAALPGVRHVREPAYATPAATATESEGYADVGTAPWTSAGWSGAGVTVGIVDVGFVDYGALVGGELPDNVISDLSLGAPDSSAHGTAVAEVIADVAPEAAFSLISFSTDVELVAALQTLLDAKVDVVNASIGFDNVWNADGSSAPSRAVDALVDNGVIVTVAAGNEARRYRVGELRAVGDGQVLLAGHAAALITAPGGRAQVSFRWDEPFGQAALDLDLVLRNADTGEECGRSEGPQDGNDAPREAIDVYGCSEQVLAFITAEAGTDPAGITGWLYSPGGMEAESRTLGPSLSLPGDADGAFTVGAWLPDDGQLAAYSSRGPTDDGRLKPDVVAPADVSTTSWGERSFRGSSAATPHATGLAALWVESTGERGNPKAFAEWARAGAADGGAAGPDVAWGWGTLAAGAPPGVGCACNGGAGSVPNVPAGAGLAITAAALYRRRR